MRQLRKERSNERSVFLILKIDYIIGTRGLCHPYGQQMIAFTISSGQQAKVEVSAGAVRLGDIDQLIPISSNCSPDLSATRQKTMDLHATPRDKLSRPLLPIRPPYTIPSQTERYPLIPP